jgi:large subunit ribosomal protein L7/L12
MNMETTQLAEELSKLTIPQVVTLTKYLEESWGVKAVHVPQREMPPPPPIHEYQTEFDVVLMNVGSNKIMTIKVAREATRMGLKETKEMVESAPVVVRTGLSKAEAEALQKNFIEVGAQVTIR